MVIASRIISIGIIIASLIVGLISFYILSDLPKEEKKKRIEELTSQLINFIIFVWVGKVLLNLPLFMQDPLAVLAYPGNSEAFYLAVLFTAIAVIYKTARKKLDMIGFADTFAYVFLISSFSYEFIQLVWVNNPLSFGYLILLAILLIIFFTLRGRLRTTTLLMTVLAGWTAGMLVLTFIQPFVIVFDYIMAPWFIIVFFIVGLLIMIFSERKGKS